MENFNVNNYICLVLAAGKSSRFGSPKLLHTMDDGHCLIEHTLQSLHNEYSTSAEIFVAVDERDTALQARLSSAGYHWGGVTVSEPSMSDTIQFAVSRFPNARGWLIALADMPYLKDTTAQMVLEAMCPERIVVPTYNKVSGHPVGFGSKFKAELLALEGDQGAKRVIRSNSRFVDYIELEDPGILVDVDRPSELLV